MEQEKKSNGALVGLIIIVVILAIGGFYVWQTNKDATQRNMEQNSILTEEDQNELDTLNQEILDLDTNIGVEADSLN
jgi:uncharacterized protein HemX